MPSVHVSLCVCMLRFALRKLYVCVYKLYVYTFTVITSHTVAEPRCKPPTTTLNIVSHHQHGTKRPEHDLFTERNSRLVDSRLKLTAELVDHYRAGNLFYFSLIFTERGK